MTVDIIHTFITSFETKWYISKLTLRGLFFSGWWDFWAEHIKKCALDTAAFHELLLLALPEAAAPYYLTLIALSLALYVSLC